jgi:hypothetical protein
MGFDIGTQDGVHARKMPCPLLFEPVENVIVHAQMHGYFTGRYYNSGALPELRIFLLFCRRIFPGFAFALRDLLSNLA